MRGGACSLTFCKEMFHNSTSILLASALCVTSSIATPSEVIATGLVDAKATRTQNLGDGLLAVSDLQYRPEATCTDLKIGYQIPAKDSDGFVPVLILPHIDGDSYVVRAEDDLIIVTKNQGKNEVLRLNRNTFTIPANALRNHKFKFIEIGSGNRELTFDWIIAPSNSEDNKKTNRVPVTD